MSTLNIFIARKMRTNEKFLRHLDLWESMQNTLFINKELCGTQNRVLVVISHRLLHTKQFLDFESYAMLPK